MFINKMNDLNSYKSQELDTENSTKYLERLKCVCRLCLSQPQEIQLFANTPQSQNNLKYSEIVMHLANVIINENDNLPKGICEECSSKLILFFKFKQKIELSQCTLSALLETTTEVCAADVDVPMYEENCDVYNPVDTIDEDSLHMIDNNQVELEDQQQEQNQQQQLEDRLIDDLESQIDYIEDTGDGDGGGGGDSIDEEAEYEIEEVIHHNIYKDQQPEDENIDQLIDETEEYHIEIIDEDVDDIGSNCGITYKIIENDNTQIKAENVKIEQNAIDEILPAGIVLKSKSNNRNITTAKREPKTGVLFHCDLCGQGFSRKSTLVQHSSVHAEEKKFECEICQKKFTRRGHVTVHMRAHNNIRPYACDTCGRAFTKSGDLSRHKKIHSDVHDYYCTICGKGFKRAEYLQSHLNMHTGVKPYRCKTCDKEYSSYSSMTKHCKKYNH